ncbi:hypothetical protein LZL87_014019 [Fusarium oxysporum]|uniref:Uncharacterized protein n=1 Tax=Fusarium oxysporum f. sp. rapae TaxID=485398 RepID=A0A8J5NRW2_FUSOX|nr:hypothetical protein Forpe1208_v010736 [Fusarium oxysporum f. sp. rapae]KAI7771385.1 hypothetical protein LZL87_014019 [Fusarium oxysporum]
MASATPLYACDDSAAVYLHSVILYLYIYKDTKLSITEGRADALRAFSEVKPTLRQAPTCVKEADTSVLTCLIAFAGVAPVSRGAVSTLKHRRTLAVDSTPLGTPDPKDD